MPGFLKNNVIAGGGSYPAVPSGTNRLAVYDPATSPLTMSGSTVSFVDDVFGNANARLAAVNGITISAGSSPNGTSGFLFPDGANAFMQPGGGNPGGWLTSAASAFTALIVMKISGNTGAPFIYGGAGGNELYSYFASNGTTAEFYATADGGSNAVGSPAVLGISTTGLHKMVVRFNAGTIDFFHNSDRATATTTVTSFNPSMTIFKKDGIYYEIHLYAGAASDADCAGLIGYATTKHGTLAS